ncbi:hypothetical protein G6011_00205 [Alternaria panax]|uniref:Uncharacterized protein n=1 Tax=Alternaria panax TaxID=48097 RepID=A0AAD4NVI6_9PLEO|nr:hypothetical protein G6011_00205 [Alternaria panax]
MSISSVMAPSQTLLPTSPATGITLDPEPKFNSTFAYVTLAALIALAILQIAMVAYLIYLSYKGECLHCRDLQQQLRKWKSGELKPITPEMVWKRDALNKAASTSNASSNVDIEMGFVPHAMYRAPTPTQLETNQKATLFQKAKAKICHKSKSSSRSPDLSADDGVDRFFTLNPNESMDNPRSSCRNTTLFPQGVHTAPNLYANRYSPYPASSIYSQTTDVGRTEANESRVFTDVWSSDIANMRGPLHKEADKPNPYTGYAPPDHDQHDAHQCNVATAEATLESREYQEAESILNRASVADSERRRALSIVNLADQRLNYARHLSAYTEYSLPLDQPQEAEMPALPESYQVMDWRKKGLRPPELEQIQGDFSPYSNQELANKRKST